MNNNTRGASGIPQAHRLAAIAIIFFCIFITYYKTLDNPFLWDDLFLIRDNYFIQDMGNLKELFTRKYFTQPIEISFRPVTTLTFFTDFALWDEHSGGYHLFNILLHFLNSMIVLTLLSRLTRKFALSVGVALLFAIHPIQTEAINLVTFREDMLCMLFAGCSVLLYIRHRDRGGAGSLILALLSAVLAMFSKETAVVLPAVILAYEYFVIEKPSWKPAAGYSLLFAIPAALYLFVRFGPMHGPAENLMYHDNSALSTLLLMIQASARYLSLLFWPAAQCIDQPFISSPSPFSANTMASAFLIVAFVILAVVFYLKRKPVLFGFLWLALFLAPVSNIVPIGVIMAERYLYIPSVGFFIALAYILDLLFLSDERPLKFLSPALLAILISVVACGLMFTTINRNRIWEDKIVFWEDACECSPESARSAVNLGIAYLEENRLDDAAETLIRAVRVASFGRFEDQRYGTLYRGLSNLGIVAARQGRMTMAVKFFSEAAELKPDAPLTHLNMGIALLKMGRLKDSEESFRKCLNIDPYNQHANLYLAVILGQTGRIEHAIRHCDMILEINPASDKAQRLKDYLISKQQGNNE